MSRALRSMLAVGTAAAMGLSLSACSLLPFGNQTHSTSLKVGQCIQLPEDDEVGDITTANCAEEHTGEVYYILTLTQDTLPSARRSKNLPPTPAMITSRLTSARPPMRPNLTSPLCSRPRTRGTRATATLCASSSRLRARR